MKILIIEDHPKLRENISKFLRMSGYVAETALHGEEALDKIRYTDYDTIVLDINMPIMNGKEFMVKLRELWKIIPVVALTSNSMLEDKLEMFDLGVDDYMTKPFELRELEVRIKAILKRKDKKIENIVNIWDLEINFSKHKVFLCHSELSTCHPELDSGSKEVELGNKEYLIIEFLVKNRWFPKSKVQLLEKVWWEAEENLDLSSTTLEAHISTIRKKIWKDFIKTIKGVWYIID